MALGERRERRREELGYGDPYEDQAIMTGLNQPVTLAPSGLPAPVANPTTGVGTVDSKPAAPTPRPSTSTTPNTGMDSSGIPEPESDVDTTQPSLSRPTSYDYMPGSESLTWGDTSNLSGFNTNQWGTDDDYDEHSYKNNFGKIATGFAPSPSGVRELVNSAQFKATFPRAKLIDHPTDPKIQFEPEDAPVDVLASSGAGGWQWLPEAEAGGGGGGGAAAGGSGMTQGVVQPQAIPGGVAGGETNLQQILDQLAAMSRGENPLEDDAILGNLRA